MITAVVTGMAPRGTVAHVFKGAGTFGQPVSHCGRWITPGECGDARLCKTCMRIGGIIETPNNVTCCRDLPFDPNQKTYYWEGAQYTMTGEALDECDGTHESEFIANTHAFFRAQHAARKLKVSEARPMVTKREMPKGDGMVNPNSTAVARKTGGFAGTPKQFDLIISLVKQIDEIRSELRGEDCAKLITAYGDAEMAEFKTFRKVRDEIDSLFGMLDKAKKNLTEKRRSEPKAAPAKTWIPGAVYIIDGIYNRVHISKSSGHPYIQSWNTETETWEYQGKGPLAKCSDANKATAEQMAQWGHEYNRCGFCSRELDRQESRTVGYGPDCADKHGLPWG